MAVMIVEWELRSGGLIVTGNVWCLKSWIRFIMTVRKLQSVGNRFSYYQKSDPP
jgi:hypothetical protein